jgi:alcohol dehydrogenase
MPSFHFPTALHWGPGSIGQMKGLVKTRAILLVHASHMSADAARELLQLPENTFTVQAPAANPDIADLETLSEDTLAAIEAASVIVAVGGGSTLDFAKLLACCRGGLIQVVEHLRHRSVLSVSALPLLLAPTTAGTGSEVTPWATVWDRASRKKYSLQRDDLWAEAAFVDPNLLESAPPALRLASGLDALSHALEAIWNHHANPISDTLALNAARDLIAALPVWTGVREAAPTEQIEARNKVSLAALKAGMAFSQTKTALAHALSYDITLSLGVPHGIACSFSLPEVWRRAERAAPTRMKILKPLFGQGGADHLERFLQELNVVTQFSHYNIHDVDAAFEAVISSPRGKNFIGALYA